MPVSVKTARLTLIVSQCSNVFDAVVSLPDGSSVEFTEVRLGGPPKVAMIHQASAHGTGASPSRMRRSCTQQEARDAEGLGGRRQSGSGARPGHKGDGRVIGRFRTESKKTTSKSFKVSLADLRKVRSECDGLEVPLFFIEFVEKGTLRSIDEWVLVPKRAWEKCQ